MNTAQLVHDISASYDAFTRLRISNPYTVFESKLIHDTQTIIWDDAQVSGSGTSSVYNTNQASVTLSVSANTAGLRARQTRQRFIYQAGKSQLIMITGILGPIVPGVIKRIGAFDAKNGIYFQCGPDKYYLVRRTYTSGSVTEVKIPQENWNKNRLDSADLINVNVERANIFVFNYEWLGVGDIFYGIVVGAKIIPLHQMYHANSINVVTMSIPNLAVRYDIENLGTGDAAQMTCICSTVISEGGLDGIGIIRTIDRGVTPLTVTTGAMYPMITFRLQENREGANIYFQGLNIVSTTTNVVFRWALYVNPTFAGTALTYTPLNGSALEYNTNNTGGATTVTDGTIAYSGYGVGTGATIAGDQLAMKTSLGVSILGVRDVVSLIVQRLDNQNNVFYASVSFREAS